MYLQCWLHWDGINCTGEKLIVSTLREELQKQPFEDVLENRCS